MQLHILAVGTRMPDWVETAWRDYAKRMPADCSLQLREIKPEPRTQGKTVTQMMDAEATRIRAALPTGALPVILDERGQDLTTMALADRLQEWRELGQDVALIIGGPDGLAPSLKAEARLRIRLSSLTLPHPMVRVLLAEQLYRAWAILHNHPYHRA
ncbi:23S rRNA (pseudouridine(1915)-N(3))-methyltransferase RlmH [Corticimicrobacter populi]|uniref:Ribosomal RNA large subunit methyltransferase H n=1 Tax=Corticimicrobacter populi TaxID=2175229 RepID=A0A2V1JXA5_9BURK|nr:23S rRNA (pseudouridine(1915)-N(3))-methyltransferase RlmH [Corticimicrobacter populi]PWF23102.1 23S rRNA (pseudouridine(1915)-N(3))-methyltransferase RlmH [Corticimicrobacter populi]